MPKSRPAYPPEFRQQMVDLVRAGRTPEELSREFEPSAQSLLDRGADGGWLQVNRSRAAGTAHREVEGVAGFARKHREVEVGGARDREALDVGDAVSASLFYAVLPQQRSRVIRRYHVGYRHGADCNVAGD